MNWLVIAAGGAVGVVARHAFNLALAGHSSVFPVGILVINALGCFAIGLLAGLLAANVAHIGTDGRLFLVVGVLGGFTTFSAYGLDTVTLFRAGHTGLALANAIGQPVAGIAAVWIGFSVGAWRL